jgi:hypothetical protein
MKSRIGTRRGLAWRGGVGTCLFDDGLLGEGGEGRLALGQRRELLPDPCSSDRAQDSARLTRAAVLSAEQAEALGGVAQCSPANSSCSGRGKGGKGEAQVSGAARASTAERHALAKQEQRAPAQQEQHALAQQEQHAPAQPEQHAPAQPEQHAPAQQEQHAPAKQEHATRLSWRASAHAGVAVTIRTAS